MTHEQKPDDAPVLPTADDPRWELYVAVLSRNRANVANIRAKPDVDADTDVMWQVQPGGTKLYHIPHEELLDGERAMANQPGARWLIVRSGERVGWIRADLVVMYRLHGEHDRQPYRDWLVNEEVYLQEVQSELSLLAKVWTIAQARAAVHGRYVQYLKQRLEVTDDES